MRVSSSNVTITIAICPVIVIARTLINFALLCIQQVSAREVDADRWLPYTAIVNNLINSVENITDPSRCCDYEFQILDKFCAAQASVGH